MELRILTTNAFDSARASWLPADFSMHTRTSGGSSDREQNAETVIPWSPPFRSFVVTTVTPLAKRDKAARNSSLLIAISYLEIYIIKWQFAKSLLTLPFPQISLITLFR